VQLKVNKSRREISDRLNFPLFTNGPPAGRGSRWEPSLRAIDGERGDGRYSLRRTRFNKAFYKIIAY